MTGALGHILAGTATDGLWSVDRRRSELGFAVKDMWGLRTVRGAFRAYEGSLELRASAAAGELAIGAARARLELPVTVEQAPDGTLRLAGTTTLSRPAAGLAWNKLGMIRGDATLHARLTLRRAGAAQAG